VILRHETPPGYPRPSHYDLMLERGDVLATWACEALPAIGAEVIAEQLADHRAAYLNLEGDVAGGRGSVKRVAAGDYLLLEEAGGFLRVMLSSPQLAGVLTLVRDAAEPQRWRVSLAAGDSPSA
jgi:hypothetical protein